MKPCPEYLDELALAAGSDLPVEEERLVLGHAETCAGCGAFLAGLTADQAVMARLASIDRLGRLDDTAEGFESLVPAVMARVTTESHERAAQVLLRGAIGVGSMDVRGRSPRPALAPFLRIAAAVVIVMASGLLGLAVLDQRDEPQPSESAQGVDDGTQLAIRRLPGEAIEVSWAGDGREGAEAGAGKPYRVLASANPRDFAGAKEVEVAGRRLVTDLPLPAARAQDRRITYFRVQ